MYIEEVIEILANEKPRCGKKIRYSEGDKTEAYEIAIKLLNAVASLYYTDYGNRYAVADRLWTILKETESDIEVTHE